MSSPKIARLVMPWLLFNSLFMSCLMELYFFGHSQVQDYFLSLNVTYILIFPVVYMCNVAGIHRNMENAKIRSLRMDSKVWTRALIKVHLLACNEVEYWY